MKKILLIALLLISATGFSQIPSTYLDVPDSTTLFYKSIPSGKLIFDRGSNRLWKTTQVSTSTDQLSTITKILITEQGLGGENLSQTLSNGNTTGPNDISVDNGQLIKATNGSSFINLRDGGVDGVININTANGDTHLRIFPESIDIKVGSFLNVHSSFLTLGQSFFSLTTFKNDFSKLGFFLIQENDTADIPGGFIPTYPVIISSQLGFARQGVINSATIGGLNVINKTNNTCYSNQFGFSTGGLFETILSHTTATQDNTISLQDGSGILAFTTDLNLSNVLSIGNYADNDIQIEDGFRLLWEDGNGDLNTIELQGTDLVLNSQGGLVRSDADFFVTGTSSVSGNSSISGNLSVGTGGADPSAILDLVSTTKGFSLPNMTTVQLNAIPTPKDGLLAYDITNSQVSFYNGTAWEDIHHSHIYGAMGFADSVITLNMTQNVFAKITNGNDSLYRTGVTNGAIIFEGDSIQVGETANYDVNWDISFHGSNTDEYHISVFINGVQQQGMAEAIRDMTGSSIGVSTSHSIFSLSAGDWIDIRIKNVNNNNDATIVAGNVTVKKI